ncbi:hypothetical protein EKE94_12225 [Mesobaculum littorinae]|uniref:Uncharacterized protein n=1 Tax=Mesobaculum littorinae TaxID=2486419 RepID=A0A438AHN6_9RHOB|nr:hypothetical protein [Mesobaculum littorinae]RVV98202.1 hypothetical protein EKE94_12225 [Mesobaculum littorinae]
MIIFDSSISNVSHDRDFGRIEATVTFVAKVAQGQPTRMVRIRTNVPTSGGASLRERLTKDAAVLARRLPAARRNLAPRPVHEGPMHEERVA